MGYFPVRYDSRVVIYDHRGFIRLATEHDVYAQKERNEGRKPGPSFYERRLRIKRF